MTAQLKQAVTPKVDLGHWIREKGRLEVQDAVCWALRLARALAELHGRARAHGHICPEAVFTRGPGRREAAMLLEPSRVAQPAGYQSADRAAGGPPTPADDVWAAGVTLYFALTGALPFRGETAAQVKERIEWAPPKQLSKHGVDARRVQRVLDRIFAPYRVERIVTAHDLQVVLTKCLTSKQDLMLIEVPHSTVIAAHHQTMESRPPADEPSIEVREVPSVASGAEVLDAWLEEREGEPAGEAEELAHWLHDDEAASSRRVVEELMAEVERTADRAEPPPLPVEPPQSARAAPEPLAAAPAELEYTGATVSTPAPSTRAPKPPSLRRARAPRWLPWLGAALVLAIAYALFGPRPPKSVPARPTSDPPATASVTAAPTAAPTASADDGAARDACVVQLFAVGTFEGAAPSFEAACRADDPRDGAQAVKTMVVQAGQGRGVTAGMVEWSRLGWYEMAAYAIVRGRCCQKPLELPSGKPFNLCDVGAALEGVHAAAAARDRHRLGKSVDGYRRAARCVSGVGMSGLFGQTAHPTPQQLEVLQKTMMRLRK